MPSVIQHRAGLCRFEPGGLDSVFLNLCFNENQTLFYAKIIRKVRPGRCTYFSKTLILLPRRCGEIRAGPLEEKGNSRTLPTALPRKSVEKTFTVAD